MEILEEPGVQKSLIEAFEQQVAQNGTQVAVLVENGTAYTYHALNNLATDIAKHIAHSISQLGPLDMWTSDTPLVTVIMNRDVGIIASFLAVFKAGAAYIPVDPTFPPDRQSYVMKQSRSHLLVIDPENFARAQSLGVTMPPTVVVDSRTGLVSQTLAGTFPMTSPVQVTQAEAAMSAYRQAALQRPQGGMAYILFTSGSTGNPKGCVAHHQSVIVQIRGFGQYLDTRVGQNILGLSTFSFDVSVLETYLPLIHGATMVLAYSSTQRDAFRLMDILTDLRIHVMQATPTSYEMLIAAGFRGGANIQLLIGGEAFRPTLIPLIAQCKAVLNIYGPTETCIWSTVNVIPKTYEKTHKGSKAMSIGVPLPYEKLYLAKKEDYTQRLDNINAVDSEGNYIEPEGELIIGGIGANGGFYLHAPEMTAKVFHPNPYGESGIIYQTGDIFRRSKEGSYFFVSRKDDQVKIDGFRIELAEIENAFKASDPAQCIETCVALVRKNYLILYLKPKATQCTITKNADNTTTSTLYITPDQLEHMKVASARSLMYYMMPKHYVVVQSFALTLNLKIDRKALPDPPEWAGLPGADKSADPSLSTAAEAGTSKVGGGGGGGGEGEGEGEGKACS
jgi:amino acid adenylation domain-containing protein